MAKDMRWNIVARIAVWAEGECYFLSSVIFTI